MFKIATCPNCKNQKLVNFMTVGTPCPCGMYLYSNDPDNVKSVEKEVAEEAFFFSNANKPRDEKTFLEFKKHHSRIMSSKAFVEFKEYIIPDDQLLKWILSQEQKIKSPT